MNKTKQKFMAQTTVWWLPEGKGVESWRGGRGSNIWWQRKTKLGEHTMQYIDNVLCTLTKHITLLTNVTSKFNRKKKKKKTVQLSWRGLQSKKQSTLKVVQVFPGVLVFGWLYQRANISSFPSSNRYNSLVVSLERKHQREKKNLNIPDSHGLWSSFVSLSPFHNSSKKI